MTVVKLISKPNIDILAIEDEVRLAKKNRDRDRAILDLCKSNDGGGSNNNNDDDYNIHCAW